MPWNPVTVPSGSWSTQASGSQSWSESTSPIVIPYGFSGVSATGGTVTVTFDTSSGYTWRVHTFLSNGTLSIVSLGVDALIEYLIVGGGGSGARNSAAASGVAAGGGGGGGMLEGNITPSSLTTYSVVVGAGAPGPTTIRNGFNGSDSSIFGVVAFGGGAGVWEDPRDGKDGGNGGGAGATNTDPGVGGAALNVGGFRGGNGAENGVLAWSGGGGGGAGGNGGDATVTVPGNGGIGRIASINGVRYAGGGGGQASNSAVGTGGAGGGTAAGSPSVSAAPNTGGGSGAAISGQPGDGGSGIVIVRYRIFDPQAWRSSSSGNTLSWNTASVVSPSWGAPAAAPVNTWGTPTPDANAWSSLAQPTDIWSAVSNGAESWVTADKSSNTWGAAETPSLASRLNFVGPFVASDIELDFANVVRTQFPWVIATGNNVVISSGNSGHP